jgi:hypothetical protein
MYDPGSSTLGMEYRATSIASEKNSAKGVCALVSFFGIYQGLAFCNAKEMVRIMVRSGGLYFA